MSKVIALKFAKIRRLNPKGTGHTSPIPPQGDWRLVFQRHGEKHPGEWVETDHPAVMDAMGSRPPCAAGGCQLDRAVFVPVKPTRKARR